PNRCSYLGYRDAAVTQRRSWSADLYGPAPQSDASDWIPVRNIDPMSRPQAYDQPPGRSHSHQRDRTGTRRAALAVQTIADVAAGFLFLWILLHLLGANEGNVFVEFVRGTANWLAGWSQDIFTM